MQTIGYELVMAARAASRGVACRAVSDDIGKVAYLECLLLHTRALSDFLIHSKRGFPTDMRRIDFAPNWEPLPRDAVTRLQALSRDLDKALAHLTWERVDGDNPEWSEEEIALDLIAVADEWARHLADVDPSSAKTLQRYVDAARRSAPGF